MNYFDNPEHKAAWEQELNSLREEREQRDGKPRPPAKDPVAAAVQKKVWEISYAELSRQEFGEKRAAPVLSKSTRQLEREKTKEAGGRTL